MKPINIRIKEIKYNNPNNFVSERQLQIGDYILLGETGFWQITGINKHNFFTCGGLTTSFKLGDSYNKIYKKEFVSWIYSLTDDFFDVNRYFIKGDYIVGYTSYRKNEIAKVIYGKISEIHLTTFWVERWMDKCLYSVDPLSIKKY